MFLSWVVVEYVRVGSVVFVFLGGMFAEIHAVEQVMVHASQHPAQ
jgi:uncharacterized membrane protein YczE